VLADERLQPADRLVVAAECKQRLEAFLADDQPLLFEPLALGPRERLLEHVRERTAAPEREGLLGRGKQRLRIRRSPHLCEQPLETAEVDGLVRDTEPKGSSAALEQPVTSERLAQTRRVYVERVHDGRRRVVAPERVDERVAWNRLVPPQEEVREQRPLLSAAECRTSAFNLQRSEQTELHHRVNDANTAREGRTDPLLSRR
jgi:hypothetical protein